MFKAQGIDRVCVIHNDRQRTSGRSRGATRERTLKSVLTSVADSIATGADADVEDLVDDIKMQVRLLESSITTMDRAIREEATLRRQGVEVAPLLMGAHEKQEEIPHGCIVVDLAKVVSAIYCDVWIELIEVEGGTPLWKKAKKVLYKILERRKQSMSDLLQFDFLDEDGNFVVTSYKDNDGKLRSYAKEKGKCLQGFAPSFARLLPMLVFIEQLAYLWLRRAKFLGHTQDIEPNERWTAHHDKEIRRVWLRVTQLCNLGIDWCKHLPARFLQLELQLKVRMHSYYAVALANLDRFYEAHRHLDEAAGLNSKRDVLLPAVERAKLRLRRAEVFLTEAHRVRAVIAILNDDTLMKSRDGETVAEAAVDVWMRLGEHWDLSEVSQDSECGADGKVQESQFPRNKVRPRIHPAVRRLLFRNPGSIRRGRRLIRDLDRLMVATLDDAWVQLEYAEGALSGQSQSNLWWGRLAVMKIRAFGYQFGRFGESHRLERSRRMLAYRHRRMNPQVIWELFEGSFLNNKRCEYRMLRLIRYTAEALRVCVVLNDEREWIETRCFDLRQRRDEIGNELEGTDRSRMFRMIGMAGHAIDRLELALSGTTAEKKQT